jgi:RNA polymerase sigma factor (sigma-70 family)
MQRSDERQSLLLDAYLQRRGDLVRFFAARMGSAAAAEDLVQDIFVRLSTLAPEAMAEVQNPSAFIYRMGVNLMLDRRRQEQRSATRDESWRQTSRSMQGDREIADEPSAEDTVAARQRLAKLTTAIAALPPQMQRAFRLHKLEGLTHAETARAMGISQSAVEKHISAALKALLGRLG